MQKKYRVATLPDHHQVIQLLEDKIYEHNSCKLNKKDGNLFSMIVRSEDSDIIAGVAGWTWANACEITQLWVDESCRKQGLGRLLLEAAEAESKSKGCQTILIRSYEFQAPAFYGKHGYRIEHIIEGFPPGQRYYILLKTIS
jgi:GNAT superfamily N-acetyltransferase